MAETPFLVEGLQLGDIVTVVQFGRPEPLSIKVVSGRVAGGGAAHILKGMIQSPKLLIDRPPLVAIKVILTFTPHEVVKERIRRELAAVERARHSHILPFIGALTTSGYTILVSRFMENGNMLDYVRANPFVSKGELILEVSDAVNHLHGPLNMVHGDLKCQNVLISDNGGALLADFGLSTTAGESLEGGVTASAIRASHTLRFAAPELLVDGAKSPSGRTRSKTTQTDIFAFAMLIVQTFTVADPWPGLDMVQIMSKLSKKESHPRPTNSVAIGFTDPWWKLCQSCWNFAPEERPSITQIRNSLWAMLEPPQMRSDFLKFDQITPTFGPIGNRDPGYREVHAWLLNAVRGAEKALEQLPPAQRSWIAVLNAFQLCPLVTPSPAHAIDRADMYTMERRNWSKRDRTYRSVGEELFRWSARLWGDLDVEKGPGDTDMREIYDIVAHAGTLLDGDNTIKKERRMKTVVDIGVLRYPDVSCPYIKVYRIELEAWCESTTVGAYTLDRNGVTAKFNVRQYEPDQRAIEGIRWRWRQDALDTFAGQYAEIARQDAQ